MISVVIPVFNEQETLPTLYARVAAAAETWGDDWELILIDDGSTDKSWSLMEDLNARDPRVKALSFSRNFGHQTAVSAGLRYTRGDAVVVMDADLQDPPEEVIHFLNKWREGYQVVYAVREQRKENVFKRTAYYTFYRLLAWMSSIRIPLDAGDFCVMDRVVVAWLNALPERNRFVRGLRSWLGFKQTGLAYERKVRLAGEAKYTFRKLLKLAFDGLVSFSFKPLRLVGMFGFFSALLAFLGMVYTILVLIFDIRLNPLDKSIHDVPGYTSLMLAILFLGGVQMLSMGILGEYLGRIFDEVKQRPLFVVRQEIGFAFSSPGPHLKERPLAGANAR